MYSGKSTIILSQKNKLPNVKATKNIQCSFKEERNFEKGSIRQNSTLFL